jgi:hypothetical protein
MSEKRFTIVIQGPVAQRLTETLIRLAIQESGFAPGPLGNKVKVWEHNKTHLCDGCNKQRRDVKSVGRDSNGEPDAPDLCFFCRKKAGWSR